MKNTRFTQDSILVQAMQQGDKKAFNTLFRKYYPMLCAYAHRFVELEDAEEVVQDTLLWLWESRRQLTINSSLNGYLLKMVHHKALNRLSQQKSIGRANTHFYEKMQEMLEQIDYYQLTELSTRIKDAIEALPPSYREAFIMHRFRHMSYKEIALALDVHPKTVDYRIQQALKRLRVVLKEYLSLVFTVLYA